MAIGIVKKPPRKTSPTFRQLLGKNVTGVTPVASGVTAVGAGPTVPNTPNPAATGTAPPLVDPASVFTPEQIAQGYTTMGGGPTQGPAGQTITSTPSGVPGEIPLQSMGQTTPNIAVGAASPEGFDPSQWSSRGPGKPLFNPQTGQVVDRETFSQWQAGVQRPEGTPTTLGAATAAMQAARPPVEAPATPMTPEQIATAAATQQAALPGQQAGAPVQTGDMMPPTQPSQTGVPGQPGVTTGGAPSTTQDLIGQFQEQQTAANLANEQRYGQTMNLYDQILGVYGPGGGFGAGFLSDIERTKQRDVAQATQSLAGSGLYGTTRTAGLGTQWEQQVGTQARLSLADQLAQRYTGALGQKAEAIERREDVAPSPELLAGLVTGAEAGPGGTVGAGEGGVGGAGGAGGGVGAGAGAVDISQYWETGQFSPDAAVRAFSQAAPADQETFLRQGVKRINNMGQKVQNKETKLEDLRAKVEAEDDPKKKQKLQRNITKVENELASFTQKRDSAQSAYDEMLGSRQLTAQAYGAGGAVGEYAQSQVAMREYEQMLKDQQRLADEESIRRLEEIKTQAYAPYAAAAEAKKGMRPTATQRLLR